MKRSPLKRKAALSSRNNNLKRGKGLAKKSKKFLEGAEERQEFGKAMIELFEIHWRNHPDRRCESCGVQLYGENLTVYHDHGLEKSKYPQYALMLDCLILVCSPCHQIRHLGYPTENHKKLIEEVKKKLIG